MRATDCLRLLIVFGVTVILFAFADSFASYARLPGWLFVSLLLVSFVGYCVTILLMPWGRRAKRWERISVACGTSFLLTILTLGAITLWTLVGAADGLAN
jgi:hypothetical protein